MAGQVVRDIASWSPSQRRVLASMSVNRNTTVSSPAGPTVSPATAAGRAGQALWKTVEFRTLVEDVVLELAQPRCRLETELVPQDLPDLLIGPQRVALPAETVEGHHQLAPGPSPAADSRRRGARAGPAPAPAALPPAPLRSAPLRRPSRASSSRAASSRANRRSARSASAGPRHRPSACFQHLGGRPGVAPFERLPAAVHRGFEAIGVDPETVRFQDVTRLTAHQTDLPLRYRRRTGCGAAGKRGSARWRWGSPAAGPPTVRRRWNRARRPG